TQKPESVQFVLGFEARPETVRLKVRCAVDPSLDETVKSVVKRELSALPKWAPPEARVGVLMRKAKSSSKAKKDLKAFPIAWNTSHDVPVAPVLKAGERSDIDGYLKLPFQSRTPRPAPIVPGTTSSMRRGTSTTVYSTCPQTGPSTRSR
ncbi:MAG: hypothetical protein ACI9OJ_003637, partial [Myxococcota bacterium]